MRKYSFRLILSIIILSLVVALGACEGSYTLTYRADPGGSIFGETVQQVNRNDDGALIEAVADRGYRFKEWSDGLTEARRKETSVKKGMTLTACFEKETYLVKYQADTGGHIQGEQNQSVAYQKKAKPVIAVANDGYEFAKWSDGIKESARNDIVRKELTLTAYFQVKQDKMYGATYSVRGGGRIEGEASQRVLAGEYASPVRVILDEGYEFYQWTDGVKTLERRDRITGSINVIALCNQIRFTIQYLNTEGGKLIAPNGTTQTALYGDYNSGVVAEADVGYEFIKWSDGNTNAYRYEQNVKSDITVTAIFAKIDYILTYGANVGGKIQGNARQSLHRLEDATSVTAIPDEGYEFVSWSDGVQTPTRQETKVRHTLDVRATFAKTDAPTYKIMMVYVDELHAKCTTTNGVEIQVDYKMSEIEKRFCEELTRRFDGYLNNLFNGKVRFIVDEYFTTAPLSEQNMRFGEQSKKTYSIDADCIPELTDRIHDYRSMITVFGMNDYETLLHYVAGGGSAKFAYVHLESYIGSWAINDYPLERMFDPDFVDPTPYWENKLDVTLHEFTHTVHLTYDAYDYHTAMVRYAKEFGAVDNQLHVTNLYLTNQLKLEGKTYGICEEYWTARYILTYSEELMVHRDSVPLESGATIYYGDHITAQYPYSYKYDCKLEMIGEGIPIDGGVFMNYFGWAFKVRTSDVQMILHVYPR